MAFASSVGPMKPVRATPAENRHALRRRVHGLVVVTIASYAPVAVELVDASDGGFAVRSRQPFWAGMIREFTFTTAAGQFVLTARTCHCTETQAGSYLSGWAFTNGTPEMTIRQLLNATTGPETVD